jgi:hypothetical protein
VRILQAGKNTLAVGVMIALAAIQGHRIWERWEVGQ